MFVQRLLDSTQASYNDKYDPKSQVIGLDIGTGASAIYPLLACRQRPSWLFLATEIDDESRQFAQQNIDDNGLASRIKILDTDLESNRIIPSDELYRFERIDILLTNPPFYTSEDELRTLAKQKSRPPNSACTGALVEMICPGGEVAFVSKIMQESSSPKNRNKIQWFSSMLGKLGSVTTVIDRLKESGCTNYAVTELVQGQKTRRWCVAWSWLGRRPSNEVARGTDAVERKYLPFPTELDFTMPASNMHIAQKLNDKMSQLDEMEWKWRPDLHAGICRSIAGNVWSRHARRRQKKIELDRLKLTETQDDSGRADGENEDEVSESNFVAKIVLQPSNADTLGHASGLEAITVRLRWLHGQDPTTFESFHGWLKRMLST